MVWKERDIMEHKKWWKEAIVYQIYPKSFQDSNGDGLGDIQGIIQRLDYLKALGITVIWLCPVYKSPMDDGGYDIADYYSVDPMFGTNEELDELIQKAAELEIKIVMDLVINHTSDEHAWFQEALNDPTSKYRDYYIFKEGVNGLPPNNWRSYFGSSAWEKVPNEDNMFYLHAFTKKQPDLNWENPEVREDLYDMVNYWLEKGLGGFRIDAILNVKKRIELGNFEADGEDGLVFIGDWILNQPGIEVWLKELNERTFKLHNSMTVAEADVPDERLAEYIGEDGFFSMVFDFSYTDIDVPETGEWFKFSNWTLDELRENIFANQLVTQEKGWGALYLENHDQPRSINKYIPEKDINEYSKKMLGTLFMFLRGTPFIYQGQELGMTNIHMDSLAEYDDIATHDQYKRARLAGISHEEAFAGMNRRSRDNSRTPMQWDHTKNAGFSTSDQTWLKVNPNYQDINADNQQTEDTLLSYYKKMITLRTTAPYKNVLTYGNFSPITGTTPAIIAYERKLDGQSVLVLINFSDQSVAYPVDPLFTQVVLNNYQDAIAISTDEIQLQPYQSLVLANF